MNMNTKFYALFGLLFVSAVAIGGDCRTRRPRQTLTEKGKYHKKVHHCWGTGKKHCEISYKVRGGGNYPCEWRD